MANTHRSERTPLLPSSTSTSFSRRPSSSRRPSNASRDGAAQSSRPQPRNTVSRPRPLSITAVVEAQEPSQHTFLEYVRGRFDLDSEPPAVRLSLTLLLLLQYRRSLKDTLAKGAEDVLGSAAAVRQAKADLETVEQQDIPGVLERLGGDVARDEELWDVLSMSWLREDEREGRVRVLDFLCMDDGVPEVMRKHDLVLYALEKRWTQAGLGQDDGPHPIRERFDALCTPRINLLLHNISLWIYFALLASYLIYPPRQHRILPDSPTQTYRAREVVLVLISLGIGLNPLYRGTLHTLSAIITFVQFIATMPDVPYPSQDAYFFLLLSLVLSFVAFHAPTSATSPMLLLARGSQAWPLALFLWQGLLDVLLPSVLVLVPSFIVIFVLLAMAMSTTPYEGPDTALLETITNALRLTNDRSNMTPMETREMLFMVLLGVMVCMGGTAFLACTRAPATAADRSIHPWDRYGSLVASRTRRIFAQSVATFSTAPIKEGTIIDRRIETRISRRRYLFPPPFNLLHLLLIGYPRAFAYILNSAARRGGGNGFLAFLDVTEAVLWRGLVGPFAATFWVVSWIAGRISR